MSGTAGMLAAVTARVGKAVIESPSCDDATVDDVGRSGLDAKAAGWLLSSDELGVRLRVRRDILGDRVPDDAFDEVVLGPKAVALLDGLGPDGAPGGGLGGTPQWRLLALLDLGAPSDDPRFVAAADWVVNRPLQRPQHRGHPTVINGLHRFCANVEGTALIVGSRAGLTDADGRLERVADALIEWQWPDGGWNCHRNARRRSTFHESLLAAKGLYEYSVATGDQKALDAAQRTAELFLQHRLIYSLGTGTPSRRQPNPPPAGEVINQRWAKLGYPSYWHYDVLAVLIFLTDIGLVNDPRASDGIDLLKQRRRPDGLWAAERQWWKLDGSNNLRDAVDWGKAGQPSEMITFHALRIISAAEPAATGQ